MKKTCFLSMLMLVAMVLPTLVACSSDDDEDKDRDPSGMAITSLGYFDGRLYYMITSEDDKEVKINKADKLIVKADIPSSVEIKGSKYKCTSIGDFAFSDCTSLTTLTIPSSVTSIGTFAFAACTSLETVELPKALTSIGNNAFFECTQLALIDIPNKVKTVGPYAFAGCKDLMLVTIPKSVEELGAFAFADCRSLMAIHIKLPDPPANESLFSDETYELATLYVPRGSISAYQNTYGWEQFNSYIEE